MPRSRACSSVSPVEGDLGVGEHDLRRAEAGGEGRHGPPRVRPPRRPGGDQVGAGAGLVRAHVREEADPGDVAGGIQPWLPVEAPGLHPLADPDVSLLVGLHAQGGVQPQPRRVGDTAHGDEDLVRDDLAAVVEAPR